MKIPDTKRMRLTLGQLRRRIVPHGVILMYHRVGERGSDPWGLCVTPQHFSEQMAVLRTHGRTLPLDQFAAAQQRGTLPNKSVAVTFDDGYADNLLNAQPLLEQHDIPATLFVTSGQIGSEREFWWDELEWLILQPEQLPETLQLEIDNAFYRWDLGTAAIYSQDGRRGDENRLPWDGEPGSRLAFYYALWSKLQLLPHVLQLTVLESIRCWTGENKEARSSYRSLTSDEIQKLGQGGVVQIGAHTVTHPSLVAHTAAYQRNEIYQSKAHLENLLNYSVTNFSYPFGNFTAETSTIVQEAGFTCACTTRQSVVWAKGDRWQLPRFEVHDWDGEEFAERLCAWL